MNIGETLAGIFGVVVGAVTIVLVFTDNLPQWGPNFLRIPPEQFRARHFLAGIGFVLVGLLMIVQGIGYFR